jgi:uncharacterized flavoprotein (TIGR03862 family)
MTAPTRRNSTCVAVIGGGPAGLMAAERLAAEGLQVDVFDAMPSVGRKFLMAGRGGLNLTHSEAAAPFLARYGERSAQLASWLQAMDATALRDWAHQLGIDTFVGSSGRVFPQEMKAAPLLRAWLARLRASGVRFHMRHRWLGWPPGGAVDPGALRFETPEGLLTLTADAVVLALGGGSWAKLGSDGAWVAGLQAHGIEVAPLRPANCGFDVAWSPHFSERYAGQPVKSVAMACAGEAGGARPRQGEFVVSETGIEGSLVYALSAALRDRIDAEGRAVAMLDLAPDWTQDKVMAAVTHPRGARSMSSHLQSRMGLTGVKARDAAACASDGRSHQHGGWRVIQRGDGWADVAIGPRRILRRRDAGLGGAYGRLSVDGLHGQRCGGCQRRAGLLGWPARRFAPAVMFRTRMGRAPCPAGGVAQGHPPHGPPRGQRHLLAG